MLLSPKRSQPKAEMLNHTVFHNSQVGFELGFETKSDLKAFFDSQPYSALLTPASLNPAFNSVHRQTLSIAEIILPKRSAIAL